MPDSETFDAFYARTVWNVTSQMHELAGDDGLADHAIREAYAKAYQQWYQVSRSRDSEAWVLATAKDAYERRRADAVGFGSGAAAEGNDSGTWPGFFRPRAEPGGRGESGADPEATVAAPRRSGAAGGDGTSAVAPDGIPASRNYPAAGAMAGDVAAGNGAPWGAAPTREGAGSPPGWFSRATRTAQPTRGMDFDGLGTGELGPGAYGGRQGPGPSGRNGLGGGLNRPGGGGLNRLATRRNLIVAGVVVAALVVVGITYAFGGGHNAPTPAATGGTSAKSAGKPKPHMLAAGRTGQRSAIPWSLVGRGWALAEYSTAQPLPNGLASGSGRYKTYLVDPLGGRYVIATWSGSAAPQLVAWSGDGKKALFGQANSAATDTGGVAAGYRILHVSTGHFTNLPLPSGVSPVGFTRPDGLNILAVQQKGGRFWLERYSLAGAVTGKVGTLPSKHESWPADGCGFGCALSSPDGTEDVAGIFGDQMQLFGNGGGRGRKLKVPNSTSCVPLSWWDGSTILADCLAAGVPDATRLWLVPDNGGTPTPLTQAAAAGNGRVVGAWQAGSAVYVASVTSNRCSGVSSTFAGVGISPAGQAGSAGAISIPGTTNNVSTVVATADRRLLVMAQTSCPGTFSLLWFNPSARSATTVIAAPSSQVGVVAAVPYGNGPTANSPTR